MKIAFDLRRITNPGIGRYMKCLVEQILESDAAREYLLILPPGAAGAIRGGTRAVREIADCSYYSIREQFEIPRILRRHRTDLLHSPHFVLPFSCPNPAVVTIHDVIYIACSQDLPSPLGRLYYRAMMHASCRLARHIITDSNFSKKEIVRYLKVDPDKISVIYPAVDPEFHHPPDTESARPARSRFGITRDYVLYTGIYKPRKKHAALLRAFRSFLSAGADAQLVIAGPLAEGEAHLRDLAQQLGIAKHIVFTGFVTDSDLRALYASARLYACPSIYEGFGFTILEAMACGTPVVCSEASSLPEVAGDAAVYGDPDDPQAFAEAMHAVFTNTGLRESLIARGHQNLRRFSWQEAASRTLSVYEAALGVAAHSAASS